MNGMAAVHRRFLLKESLISTLIGAVVSLAISFMVFRTQNQIPFWGADGLFLDLILTVFFMTFMMTLAMTPMYRGRVGKGTAPAAPWPRSAHPVLRFLPGLAPVRALMIGALYVVALVSVSTVLLLPFKEFPVSLRWMLVFKSFYGALTGLLVTPVIAVGAIADLAPA